MGCCFAEAIGFLKERKKIEQEIREEIKRNEELEKKYEKRLEELRGKIGLTDKEFEEKEWLEDYFEDKSRIEDEMYFANGCR